MVVIRRSESLLWNFQLLSSIYREEQDSYIDRNIASRHGLFMSNDADASETPFSLYRHQPKQLLALSNIFIHSAGS